MFKFMLTIALAFITIAASGDTKFKVSKESVAPGTSVKVVQRREGRVLIDGELGAQGMVVVEGTQRMRNGIDVVYDERRESDSLAGNGAGTFAGSD